MDFITEIFGYLGGIEEYFEYFVQLAVNIPFLAVVISTPIIAVLFYIFIERGLDFIAQLKSKGNKRISKTWLIVILSISTFISILFVNNIVQAKTIRPIFLNEEGEIINLENNELKPIDLLGENISLKWENERDNILKKKLLKKNKSLMYKIEYSNNKKFDKAKNHGFSKNNNAEIEVTFNRTSYWRVTPGFFKSDKEESFTKLSLPSRPLKISQYSDIKTRIQKEKKLRVCTSKTSDKSFLSYLPEGQYLNLNADPVGLEPELIKMFSQNIFKNIIGQEGKVEFIKLDWNKLFDDVGHGKCDMAISSISITKDREKDYNLIFSKPYFKTNLVLISNGKKNQSFSTDKENLLEIMQGKKVGVLTNSTSLKTIEIFNNILQKNYPDSDQDILIKPQHYPRTEKALYNLVTPKSKIDFVLADKVYADSFLFGLKKRDIKIVDELTNNLYPKDFPEDLKEENYGVAVNYTASDILEYINETIEKLEKLKVNNGFVLENMIKKHEQEYYNSAIKKEQSLHTGSKSNSLHNTRLLP